jgi:hypothetical protein
MTGKASELIIGLEEAVRKQLSETRKTAGKVFE